MALFSHIKNVLFALIAVVMLIVSCASVDDTAYDVQNHDDVDQDESLAECESQEFLTTDCADLIADEADRKQTEQATIVTAKNNLNDFDGCYLYSAAEEEGDAETTTACADAVSLVLAGFDSCTALAEANKYYECSAIEDAVNAAVALCDASSTEVTTDFCALVNPTTDETTE